MTSGLFINDHPERTRPQLCQGFFHQRLILTDGWLERHAGQSPVMLILAEATVVTAVQHLDLFSTFAVGAEQIEVRISCHFVERVKPLLNIMSVPLMTEIERQASGYRYTELYPRINSSVQSRCPPPAGKTCHGEIPVLRIILLHVVNACQSGLQKKFQRTSGRFQPEQLVMLPPAILRSNLRHIDSKDRETGRKKGIDRSPHTDIRFSGYIVIEGAAVCMAKMQNDRPVVPVLFREKEMGKAPYACIHRDMECIHTPQVIQIIRLHVAMLYR